ncbi:MAG: stage III sporulation protein AC [Clostridia bacterium]|nr:stage III sporulation protein AC [Clostridia bacterium]MBO5433739.1 stage III sporulation protein AC [Clostridia bacterium]MBP3560352.1 stage III sporulation protein AC [Clostridia bacterium]
MDITIIFKIAVVGIVTAIINQLLQKAGKEEYSLLLTIAGLLIVLMMLLPELNSLKDELSSVMTF